MSNNKDMNNSNGTSNQRPIVKCIDVALVGRPSAGKSTFINTLLGTELSIVASTPQTTQKVIRGIYTEDRGQIVILDTPGVSSFDKRTKEISRESLRSLKASEAILFIVDAFDDEKSEAERLTSILSEINDKPVYTLINKCDSVSRDKVEKRKNYIKSHLPESKIFEISALKDEGIDDVLIELFKIAEEREMLFDEDTWTDEPLEDRVSEAIRGAAIQNLKNELPHIVSIRIEDMEYNDGVVWIRAFIGVDRESQKGIVIGKKGAMIALIKKDAQRRLKKIFPDAKKIDLNLTVRVKSK